MRVPHIHPKIISRIKRMLTGQYIEDGNTASQNIAAGKYVIWKNQLCKATTAITTGDTLSSSNLEAVADGGINALNSKITAKSTIKYDDFNLTFDGNGVSWIDTKFFAIKAGGYFIDLSKGSNYIHAYSFPGGSLATNKTISVRAYYYE